MLHIFLQSFSLSLSIILSILFYLSPSFFISLSLSVSLTLSPSISHSLYLARSLSLHLSLSLTLSICLSLSLHLSLSHSLSFFLTVIHYNFYNIFLYQNRNQNSIWYRNMLLYVQSMKILLVPPKCEIIICFTIKSLIFEYCYCNI